MASKNSIKLFVCAGLMLAASGAFAAVSQTFGSSESSSLPQDSGKWVGDGTLVSVSSAPTSVAGQPVADSNTIVLSVEGEVSCTNTTGSAAAASQADFLINIVDPSEELPGAADLGTLQIAVAAGTNVVSDMVPLAVYCKPNTGNGAGESAAWTNVTTVATGSWHRVTLAFDYASGYCRLSLDGVPVVSDAGFLSTNRTDEVGSWYKLVGNTETDYIESLTFRGVASVDDVVIGEAIAESFTGTKSVTVDGVAVNVSYDDLNKWGIDDSAESLALELDDSGLSVAEKLECGLDPLDGNKFEAVAMSLGDGTATFTLPAGINKPASTTYTVYCSDNSAELGSALTTTFNSETKVLSVSGVPSTSVLYFTIKAD